MTENKTLRFFLILALCLAIPLGLLIAKWQISPTFQERVYQAGLLIPVGPIRFMSADALKHYPSRNSALALAAFLNLSDKQDEWGQRASQEALASLCLLSGQDFGTGFEGTITNYGWGPPTGDAWPEALKEVNVWAAETFGAEMMAGLVEWADEGEFHFEYHSEESPTNE